MDIFIGAEYVIANALIALRQQGKHEISFNQLRRIGWKLQKLCNENQINAIIITSGYSIKNAVEDFPDYFVYGMDGEIPVVRIGEDVRIADLEDRFVYCLPAYLWNLISQKMPSLLVAEDEKF